MNLSLGQGRNKDGTTCAPADRPEFVSLDEANSVDASTIDSGNAQGPNLTLPVSTYAVRPTVDVPQRAQFGLNTQCLLIRAFPRRELYCRLRPVAGLRQPRKCRRTRLETVTM